MREAADEQDYLRTSGTGSVAGFLVAIMLIIILIGGVTAITLAAIAGNLILVLAVTIFLVLAFLWTSPLLNTALKRGGIRLSSAGITTAGPLVRRTVRWHEITAIEVLPTRAGRFAYIRLRNGTHRRLAAPRDTGPHPDPDFDEKVLRIHRWWEVHRKI